MSKPSKVYFTSNISSEGVLKLYKTLNYELKGNVCIKVHSGEPGNQNFLRPDFWDSIIKEVNGTIVECNTAYDGRRNTSSAHLETLKEHGWAAYNVDLMDEEGPDLELDIPKGTKFTIEAILDEGAEFLGWYDQYNRLLSNKPIQEMYAHENATYTARIRRILVIDGWHITFRTVPGENGENEVILSKVLQSGNSDLVIPETVKRIPAYRFASRATQGSCSAAAAPLREHRQECGRFLHRCCNR